MREKTVTTLFVDWSQKTADIEKGRKLGHSKGGDCGLRQAGRLIMVREKTGPQQWGSRGHGPLQGRRLCTMSKEEDNAPCQRRKLCALSREKTVHHVKEENFVPCQERRQMVLVSDTTREKSAGHDEACGWIESIIREKTAEQVEGKDCRP